jgi:protein-disulfide isomerase
MKIARWFGALGFVALASLGCFAQAAEFTPEQKGAIEGIIREYLLKNPDVLQEALGELERRQQETQRGAQRDAVESEKQALFNSPNDAVVGNQKGNATLVVFFDYNCPYCKKAATDLDELMKSDPNLRVVLKEFPVVRPPDSLEAARIALAARQQLKDDKYFDFHMRLMTAKGLVNKERALEVAKEMKLDMAKLAKDTEAEEIRAAIQSTVRLGDKLGITGTPSFVVGDLVISGAVGNEPLRQALVAVRACGKATC